MGQNERVAFNRIHYHVQNWIAGGNVLYDTGCSGPLPCDDNLEGSDAGKVGGDTCIPVTDSCGCMAEINTIL